MQNERIKTEKHIEYDSDDTPDSGKKCKLLKQFTIFRTFFVNISSHNFFMFATVKCQSVLSAESRNLTKVEIGPSDEKRCRIENYTLWMSHETQQQQDY